MRIGPLDCDRLRDGSEQEQEALRFLAEERRRALKRLVADLAITTEEYDSNETPSSTDNYRLLSDSNIAVNTYNERCHEAVGDAIRTITGVDMDAVFQKLLPLIVERELRGFGVDADSGEVFALTADGEKEPLEEVAPELIEVLRTIATSPLIDEEGRKAFEAAFGPALGAEIDGIGSFEDIPVVEPERPKPPTDGVRDFDGGTE